MRSSIRALAFADEWLALLAAYRWLQVSRDSRRYLREITAPGVDPKFVERHRGVLAELLGVPSSAGGFVRGLGLVGKPQTLRIRSAQRFGLAGLSDVTARVEELAGLELGVNTAVIVENEITFLSLLVSADGVVLWGKGFEVDRAASMPWLAGADVVYWGDLDTHGFAILNQLRAWLPQTRSVLMDRDTLLTRSVRRGREPTPTAAALNRLSADESALYRALVTDRLASGLRRPRCAA